MADIGGVTLSAGSSPVVNYTITYTKSRPNNSQMTYNFTISCALGSSGSYINAGYALLCTLTVNGSSNDVRTPTWEDATAAVIASHAHVFENTTVTAIAAAVNIRVTVARGSGIGECWVSGIGGNFECQ